MFLIDSEYLKKIIVRYGLDWFMQRLCEQIENDYLRWDDFIKSPRHAVHVPNGVMELMPCSDGQYYSFKYVNGHPINLNSGKLSIVAFGVLAETDTGLPCLLSEMTWLTAIRTACMSAVVAKYAAPKNVNSIGIIGCGAQSEFQMLALSQISGCRNLGFYDLNQDAMSKFAKNLEPMGFNLSSFKSASELAMASDILVTSTAYKGHQSLLQLQDIDRPKLILAIGGDCPGKTELSKEFLMGMDEIWVEYLPQTKVEGEIQQLDDFSKVIEFKDIVQQSKAYYRSEQKNILFDGVGFAIQDFSVLKLVYDLIKSDDATPKKAISPDLIDPRNLFGALYD